jgi:hypothetical protein
MTDLSKSLPVPSLRGHNTWYPFVPIKIDSKEGLLLPGKPIGIPKIDSKGNLLLPGKPIGIRSSQSNIWDWKPLGTCLRLCLLS